MKIELIKLILELDFGALTIGSVLLYFLSALPGFDVILGFFILFGVFFLIIFLVTISYFLE